MTQISAFGWFILQFATESLFLDNQECYSAQFCYQAIVSLRTDVYNKHLQMSALKLVLLFEIVLCAVIGWHIAPIKIACNTPTNPSALLNFEY